MIFGKRDDKKNKKKRKKAKSLTILYFRFSLKNSLVFFRINKLRGYSLFIELLKNWAAPFLGRALSCG